MPNSPITALGIKIRKLRLAKGWRQIDLAAYSGMSENYISDLETGKKEICLLSLLAIADSFGIEAADLLKGL